MASFIYFEPKGEKLPDEYRARCGNGITEIFNGPGESKGNARGGYAYDTSNTAYRVKYLPKEQTWRQIPDSTCWIGYYTKDRPKPSELSKPNQLHGHRAGEWLVPVARDFTNGQECCLPAPMDLNKDGEWVRGDIVEEYRPLWEVATTWWDFVGQTKEDQTTVLKVDACEMAVTALAVNYYVGRMELAMMGALLDDFVGEVLDSVCDIPSLNEILKKKQAIEQLNTNDGEPVEPLATTLQ